MRTMLPGPGFVDETSPKTNMAKTTGRAPGGARPVDHAPFGHWQRQTFIAAPRHDRLDAPRAIGGAINRGFFDLHVETRLAPTLQKGDVLRRENDPPDHFLILLILDNLGTHKGPKAAALLQHPAATHWRMVPAPAAILPRSQPDRDQSDALSNRWRSQPHLRQAQDPEPKGGSRNP